MSDGETGERRGSGSVYDIAESLPEPFAALTREHRTIAEVVEQARNVIGVAAKVSGEEPPAAETIEGRARPA
jgi:hypothetical protein